jgi:hypothetical protein
MDIVELKEGRAGADPQAAIWLVLNENKIRMVMKILTSSTVKNKDLIFPQKNGHHS